MRLPRKGILIRLCIYLPLLGYFGWRAYDRWRSEQAPAVETGGDGLDPYRRKITLPDGREQEYIELTPEQAEQLLGPLPKEGAPTPGEVKAGAPPQPGDASKPEGKTP